MGADWWKVLAVRDLPESRVKKDIFSYQETGVAL